MVYKWIKLDTVLSDVAGSLDSAMWDENDVREWAFRALRSIGGTNAYERDVESLEVTNYKACLPDDLRVIELLAYKIDDSLTDDDVLENIMADLGYDNDYYYQGFTGTNWFSSQYAPLRLASSPWARTVHCENCVNIYSISEHTYTVNANNTITTSFETGTVCLAYLRLPKDADGDYLVPDIESVLDAIRYYVLMRLWEYRMNMKEEGSANLHMHYKRMWSVAAQKAKGEMLKPSLDQLENIRQSRNRLVPKERNYYKGFNNRSEEELDF